jgi:hypothetical protein
MQGATMGWGYDQNDTRNEYIIMSENFMEDEE